jgi:GcrA cell cycle regulator
VAPPPAAARLKVKAPAGPAVVEERPAPALDSVVVPLRPALPVTRESSEVALSPSERVTIMDLRETSCRWPMGDPSNAEFRFCGAKTCIGDGPYCAAHARLAFQPSHDRRRERVERFARIA